jgi:hypothetical protein
MVRPVEGGPDDLNGTAEDDLLYICTRGTEIRWAFLIFVRTGFAVHAFLVPIFEDPEAGGRSGAERAPSPSSGNHRPFAQAAQSLGDSASLPTWNCPLR